MAEVSASKFAQLVGVSAMAVSKGIKKGILVRNSMGLLDTEHVLNKAYIEKHRLKKAALIDVVPTPASLEPQRLERTTTQGAARELLDMTLRQIVMRHRSLDNLEKYASLLQRLTVADEREQRTQEKRLLQIPKDFVVQRVFGYVDSLMGQLLDVPESVCDQVIAVSLAGGDGVRASVMHIISDSLTRCISGAKEHITGELNALKGKYDKRESAVQGLVAQEIERMGEAG